MNCDIFIPGKSKLSKVFTYLKSREPNGSASTKLLYPAFLKGLLNLKVPTMNSHKIKKMVTLMSLMYQK